MPARAWPRARGLFRTFGGQGPGVLDHHAGVIDHAPHVVDDPVDPGHLGQLDPAVEHLARR
jgi:hypothetical protein